MVKTFIDYEPEPTRDIADEEGIIGAEELEEVGDYGPPEGRESED